MKYEEVVEKIADKQETIDNKSDIIRNLGEKIRQTDRLIRRKNMEYEVSLEEEETRELKKQEKEALSSVETKIKNINADLTTTKERYDRDRNNRSNLDYYKEKYKTDYELVNKVSMLSEQVYDSAIEALGKDLAGRVKDNLDNYKFKKGNIKIQDYKGQIFLLNKQLKKIRKPMKFNVPIFIDNLLEKLNPCKEEPEDEKKLRNGLLIYLALCFGISITVIYFSSKYLLLIIIGLGIYNLRRSSMLEKAIMNSKYLMENVERIKVAIDDDIKQNRDRDLETLDTKYNDIVDRLKENRGLEEAKIPNILEEVKSNFQFDSTPIELDFRKGIEQLENSNKTNKIELDRATREKEELEYELKLLEKELENSVEEVKKELTSFKGNNTKYKVKYVFDILDDEIVYWSWKKEPCLIIHEDYDLASNFINLIVSQAFSYYNLDVCLTDIIDTEFMGIRFSNLFKVKTNSRDATRGVVEVDKTKEDVEKHLSYLFEELNVRISTVGAEPNCSNVEDYNNLMRLPEIDGTVFPYILIFIYTLDMKTLLDTKTSRIINNGCNYGMMPIVFQHRNELSLIGDDVNKITEQFNSVYLLTSKNIKPCSKAMLNRIFNMNT